MRIVGSCGAGLVACSSRFPRLLATGCALHGASLSLVWPRESNQREGHPDIRVSLRETPLPPVPLRGPAYKGRRGPLSLARHPCLASPSTTPALGLLTGRVARPNLQRLARNRAATTGFSKSAFCSMHGLAGWDRVPSGGRVESTWKGIGGRDAAKGVKGLGCPLYAGPWNGDGAREVWRRSRQTRMSGVLSLWLLSLCTGKEKVTRRKGEKRGWGCGVKSAMP